MTLLIYQITDIHIPIEGDGEEHFRDNFLTIMAYIRQNPPDLLVITGDLAFDQPDAYEWTREQLPASVDYVVIPGNHDNSTDLFNAFPNAHVINEDFYFTLATDDIDLVFANSAAESIPHDQLEKLGSAAIRPGSMLFVHHPTKVLSAGFMDLTYQLRHVQHADRVISAGNIKHVFCGHFHCEHEIHDDYSLYLTPSPAFEINLHNPKFTLEPTRIPIRRIEVEGRQVTTSVIDLTN